MREIKLYTLREVAELTRQNIETVRRQVQSGELVGTPIGTGKVRRRWLVSDENLRSFLDWRTESAQPGPKPKRATAKPRKEWV